MRRHLLTVLTAAGTALLIALGAVGSFGSVYLLEYNSWVPVLICLIAAGAGALLLPRRRGPEVLLGLTALALGYVCFLPETAVQVRRLLAQVSGLLDGIYQMGRLDFQETPPGGVEIPLALWGGVLTLLLLRSLLRGRSRLLPVLLCLPVWVLCGMMVTNMPRALPLACHLAGMALLLLSGRSWKNAAEQGRALTLLALIPVAALLAVLFWRNPQADYQDHAEALRQRYLELLEGRTVRSPLPAAVIPEPDRSADLAALTGGVQPRLPILVVTAPVDGDLYLRGQDFDIYTGLGWQAGDQRTEAFSGWGDSPGEIHIRTFALQSVLYLPYYPGSGTVLTGGAVENTGGVLSYDYPVYPQGSAAEGESLAAFLRLPESTAAWAGGYAFPGNTPDEIAEAVGAFVRGSAEYDLTTGQMPPEKTDFARWFLEDCDTGYCVHFATAATVLLRAQGIPARYVTGFLCRTEAGKAQVVSTLEAHAWAEYYDSDLGAWRILEATAPAADTRPEPVTVPAITEAAAHPVTEDAETLPAETAAPSETAEVPTAAPEAESGRFPWWLPLPALLLLLPLRRWMVLRFRADRRRRAEPNRRCLLLWQEAERLSRAMNRQPPETLHELAQRACYSPHRLTALDLVPLRNYCGDCRAALEEKPPLRRLTDKYIRILY